MRLVVVMLGLALAARVARADSEIGEAMRLESQLEYDKALPIVEHVISEGTIDDPHGLIMLHVMAGRLAAGLDRIDVAEDHFERALALDPSIKLPDGTSPKITTPFDNARSKIVPLRIEIVGDVTLRADPDPLQLLAGVSIEIFGPVHRVLREPHGLHVDLPADASRFWVRGLDVHGNAIWAKEIVKLAVTPRPVRFPQQSSRPLYRSGILWGSTAAAGLLVAGISALEFRSKQHAWNDLRAEDGMHDYSELHALETSAHHWAYGAYAGLGVAAVGVVMAAILVPKGDPAPIVYTSDHSIGIGAVGRF